MSFRVRLRRLIRIDNVRISEYFFSLVGMYVRFSLVDVNFRIGSLVHTFLASAARKQNRNRFVEILWTWFPTDVTKYALNSFLHNDTFWRPWQASLLKTLWEKEKLLVTSNFSFTHSVFYPWRELSAIFIKFKIVACTLFQFGPV